MMEGTLRVGICDDKPDDLKLIETAVYDSAKRIGISVPIESFLFQDGEKMYEEMEKDHFDLVLLDIEMPGMNGFQLAKRISMERGKPSLIFVSAHESFVFNAQTFMPLWFVRKSMLAMDMHRAMQKYAELTVFKKACCILKGGPVYIRNIVYIECSGHLLTIQMIDKKMLKQYGSLKILEEELSKYNFLRIHKSYLVNPRYIAEIGRQEVLLTNGATLEMGRDRRKELLQAMHKFEGENYGVK